MKSAHCNPKHRSFWLGTSLLALLLAACMMTGCWIDPTTHPSSANNQNSNTSTPSPKDGTDWRELAQTENPFWGIPRLKISIPNPLELRPISAQNKNLLVSDSDMKLDAGRTPLVDMARYQVLLVDGRPAYDTSTIPVKKVFCALMVNESASKTTDHPVTSFAPSLFGGDGSFKKLTWYGERVENRKLIPVVAGFTIETLDKHPVGVFYCAFFGGQTVHEDLLTAQNVRQALDSQIKLYKNQ